MARKDLDWKHSPGFARLRSQGFVLTGSVTVGKMQGADAVAVGGEKGSFFRLYEGMVSTSAQVGRIINQATHVTRVIVSEAVTFLILRKTRFGCATAPLNYPGYFYGDQQPSSREPARVARAGWRDLAVCLNIETCP